MEHLKCQVEGAGLAIYVAALQDIWRREETWAGSQAALQQLVSFHLKQCEPAMTI